MLNELIAKIKQDITTVDKNSETQMIIDYFNRTIAHIKAKSDVFEGIDL